MQKKSYIFFTVFLFLINTAAAFASQEEPMAKGQLYIKLKPAFAYLNADGKGMRAKSLGDLVPSLGIYQARPFSTDAPDKALHNRFSTHKGSGIDLRLYHQLSFDEEVKIEEAIAQLYKTGLVEVAEPVFRATSLYTPNDTDLSQQYYVPLIKALEAWDITKGDPGIVIAIIDTGVDLDHPDLRANIYRNEADPENGLDDDGDGYVDNYWGWDFAGDDYNTLVWDNNPTAKLSNISHGTKVAGCASAVTDNGTGMAGIGFNAKLMVLKHSAENDKRSGGRTAYLENLLYGVIYAARQGADIINASYGSGSYSQIEQDIYKWAALDQGVTIVAAAGNSGTASPNFPSDYDYVLSVSASTSTDERATFSNYGYKVDIAAPGADIYTTNIGGGYTTAGGTSFSSPLVAGAAALVKSMYPHFDGAQIAEVLRVTSDPAFNANLEATYKDQMGRGRLDVLSALSNTSPSIRIDSTRLQGPQGVGVSAGEEASIWGKFVNFLWPASGAQVSLTSLSEWVTISQGSLSLGNMDTYASLTNENTPFKIQVSENAPYDLEVVLRLDYTAADYTDYQFIKIFVNPSFVNVDENALTSTIGGTGRIGYWSSDLSQGEGFVFNHINMLFEMGVMMTVLPDSMLVNTVRNDAGGYDDDFRVARRIHKAKPGTVADVDIDGSFDDSRASTAERLGVKVDYGAFVWQDAPYKNFIMLEYKVINEGTKTLENFYHGLYADWDISAGGANDKAGWDAATGTGYVYTSAVDGRKVAGVQLLSEKPNYWALDNDASIIDNPFGVYDGFTKKEKITTLSSGLGRTEAGVVSGGNDVSHTVAAGPFTIAPGDSVTIAYALHGGSSITAVEASAAQASLLYQSILESRGVPVLGLEGDAFSTIRLYPNPAKGFAKLILPLSGNQAFQIRIMDYAGRQLSTTELPANVGEAKLQLPPSPGMYLIEIRQGSRHVVKRVVNMP